MCKNICLLTLIRINFFNFAKLMTFEITLIYINLHKNWLILFLLFNLKTFSTPADHIFLNVNPNPFFINSKPKTFIVRQIGGRVGKFLKYKMDSIYLKKKIFVIAKWIQKSKNVFLKSKGNIKVISNY